MDSRKYNPLDASTSPTEGINMDQCCPNKEYSVEWDAYYCPHHNIWLENKCEYEYIDCPFGCSERPERPLPVNN